MKFFISTDMEGACGTVSWEEYRIELPRFRRIVTNEVSAVIEGIRDSGRKIDEILVCDAHGSGCDLLFEELPQGVFITRGRPRPLGMVDGIDETFDLLFFVGYHSMIGTESSVMDHTYSSATFYSLKINGILVSEAMINAAIAGNFNVPLGFVSGDDKLIAHIKEVFGEEIETVTTKYSRSRFAAKTRHPKDVILEIREKAKRAVLKKERFKPFTFKTPCIIEMECNDTLKADSISLIPGCERTAGRIVKYIAQDFLSGYKIIRLAATLGAASG